MPTMDLSRFYDQLPKEVQAIIAEQAARAERDVEDHVLYLLQYGCMGEQMRYLDDTMRLVLGLAPRRYPFAVSIEDRLADLELSSHALTQNECDRRLVADELPGMVSQWRLIRSGLKRLFG
jgi:predicted nucleic acid-binding protein